MWPFERIFIQIVLLKYTFQYCTIAMENIILKKHFNKCVYFAIYLFYTYDFLWLESVTINT